MERAQTYLRDQSAHSLPICSHGSLVSYGRRGPPQYTQHSWYVFLFFISYLSF